MFSLLGRLPSCSCFNKLGDMQFSPKFTFLKWCFREVLELALRVKASVCNFFVKEGQPAEGSSIDPY